MTKFSFEVPIAHLEDFDDLQDFYFMLSILYRSIETYREFHDKKPTKLKWMDNSYNELMFPDQVDNLVACARQSKASKVVCPDNPKWSTLQIREKYEEMKFFFPPEQLVVVVNSEEMYKELLKVGVRNFAVSYWTRPKNIVVELVHETIWMSNLHFLGLLTLDELKCLNPPSCDTSMPIKLAMIGQTMEDWIKEGCPHINTKDLGTHGTAFFTARLDPDTLKLARDNIIWLKEKVNG